MKELDHLKLIDGQTTPSEVLSQVLLIVGINNLEPATLIALNQKVVSKIAPTKEAYLALSLLEKFSLLEILSQGIETSDNLATQEQRVSYSQWIQTVCEEFGINNLNEQLAVLNDIFDSIRLRVSKLLS